MNKIAIIGRGTAGAMTATHFLTWLPDIELHWYFDPNTQPQAIGEGTTIDFSRSLKDTLQFGYKDLKEIDGTVKLGTVKKDWGGRKNEFYCDFWYGTAYHFSAPKLQDFLYDKIKSQKNVFIHEGNFTHDEIDADYIIDCSGVPKVWDDHLVAENIPINAVHVTQCHWKGNRESFNHTQLIAKEHGWVFMVPLENRCAVGYLYNHDINNVEEIISDKNSIFDEYDIIPTETENNFQFKNFYRKENFTERVAYSGNASFFFDPLEATSFAAMNQIQRETFDIITAGKPLDVANRDYHAYLKGIEAMICLHYMSGSAYDSPFWNNAVECGERVFTGLKDDTEFLMIYNSIKNYDKEYKTEFKFNHLGHQPQEYGTWPVWLWHYNMKQLNVWDKISHIIEN